jgi:phage-related protein
MATFPTLKTGAVAQYPSERSRQFSTAVYEFVDGSEQRFSQYGSALRRWSIRFDQLDDAELFELERFFLEQGGAVGSFEFTDPWDNVVYANCSVASDEIEVVFAGVGKGQAELVVKENR